MQSPRPVSKCPICETPQSPQEQSHRPFCSARCRMIDLGNWLGGTYTVPGTPSWDELPNLDENVH